MLSHFVYSTRKKGLLGLLCLLPALTALSPLSVGSSPLFITNGTTVSIDSLILIPSVDLTLNTNSVAKVGTPVNSTTPGITSLARVYNIGTPFTFSGTLGLIYQDGELRQYRGPVTSSVQSDGHRRMDDDAGQYGQYGYQLCQ